MKKIILITLVVALLLSGCKSSDKPIDNASVSKTDTQSNEVYIMAGKVDTEEQATVSSKISARVANIAVDVGSQVNKGDTIIQLDTADIQAQVQQAEAAVSTAQASLENVAVGSRPEQIDQAQASLDSAKKNYETVKSNFDRTQKLYNDVAISQKEMEAAQASLAAAEAQYKSAQSQLDIVKQGATKESVNVVRKQLLQSQAALEVSKTQLTHGEITAPVSGTVATKNIKVGELATAGLALLTIVNSGDMYVKAYLPENLAGQVKQGQQVLIKISELSGKKYEGEIAVVNPVVNSQSKNVMVKVMIKNPDSELKLGMYTEIALKK